MREAYLTEEIYINADEEIGASYFSMLADVYKRIPADFSAEKRLIELFAKYVMLYPKNEKNPIGKTNGRYETEKRRIVVDIADDLRMKNPGAIFYHEMGHLITHRMEMHANGVCYGLFQKFNKTLRKEGLAYVKQWEKEARDLTENYSMSKKDKKEFIERKIPELMETDMLGYVPHSFAYDNLSDILDGCTHDRFQLGSGHDPNDEGISYWDYVPHLPDEAFANMFRCRVLGLYDEYALIQRIFPKSSAIYEEIVAKVLSRPKRIETIGSIPLGVIIVVLIFCPLAGALLFAYNYAKKGNV